MLLVVIAEPIRGQPAIEEEKDRGVESKKRKDCARTRRERDRKSENPNVPHTARS